MTARHRRSRRSRVRRPTPSPPERVATWAACIASGLVAASAGARPSGTRASDLILAFGLGAATAAAASLARTWAWLVLAGTAGTLARGGWSVVGLTALLGSTVGAFAGDLPWRRLIGSLVGAAAVNAVLRVDGGPFGLTAAVTAAAVACVAVSGWRLARQDVRRRLRFGMLALGGMGTLVAASFALSALQGRSAVEVGTRRAQEGLAAARDGDTELAAELLGQASRAFSSAHRDLGSWFARPARILPGVGQQARALDLLSKAGAEVAAAAAEAATNADVQSLQLRDGRLDLERVAEMRDPLDAVLSALEHAGRAVDRAESSWLTAPVASRLDTFAASVADALEGARTAAEAVAIVPALLGGEGPRHYFIAFATPSEARDLGGFTGDYGELVAVDGELNLVRNGRVIELNEAGEGRQLTDPTAIPGRMTAFQLDRFWQNVTATPDFPTAAEAVRQLWPQSGGGALDGVLYVDPYALAALLQLTGPVSVEGLDEPLSADNAAEFLLRDQYTAFDVSDARQDFLSSAARTVFTALTSGDLPGPRTISDALSPVARQRRLLLHSFHPAEQALFERLGVDGSLPGVGGGDVLTVRSSNLGADKIDAFLDRAIDYAVTVDPSTGRIAATLTVTLDNRAPAAGLPDYVIGNDLGQPPGTNIMSLAVYTPFSLVEATSDGQPLPTGLGVEYGRNVITALASVPPGERLVLTFELGGTVDLVDGYQLSVVPQPLVNADRVHVEVGVTPDWEVIGVAELAGPLEQDQRLTVTFRAR